MRTLIRNTTTGLFVQAPGQWTAQLEQAMDFRHRAMAVQKATAWQLRDVELVFALEDSPQLLASMPLEPKRPHEVSACTPAPADFSSPPAASGA